MCKHKNLENLFAFTFEGGGSTLSFYSRDEVIKGVEKLSFRIGLRARSFLAGEKGKFGGKVSVWKS